MNQRYLSGVATLVFSPEKCTACGRCREVCPHGVFAPKERTVVVTDRDKCMECGACESNCAFGAITVKSGVGCAAAMINGLMTKGNPDLGTCDCDCGSNGSGCC
ncbi:MAG: 4Fe-4S binding protein [Chitinispirillaceae bacterium]|jgi:NAD-dependent dihydropyrimidine dehydrogenase PreA subunit|nr:4Fe-4S binding protein [Chitinispirillaceae bacterium]